MTQNEEIARSIAEAIYNKQRECGFINTICYDCTPIIIKELDAKDKRFVTMFHAIAKQQRLNLQNLRSKLKVIITKVSALDELKNLRELRELHEFYQLLLQTIDLLPPDPDLCSPTSPSTLVATANPATTSGQKE